MKHKWRNWLAEGVHGGHIEPAVNHSTTYSLVAFPAKDNYEGVLYPLDWVDKVRNHSTKESVFSLMTRGSLVGSSFAPHSHEVGVVT